MFKKVMSHLLYRLVAATATIAALASYAAAQDTAHVDVADAWVRATVAGQQGTGGFMKLTAHENLRLLRVSSPAADVAEIHEMKMGANNVMEMRPISGLDLPKGKTVELKPGGYHLMLMSLKQPLAAGRTVPVTLLFTNSKGVESKLVINAPIAQTAAPTKAQTGGQGTAKPEREHEHGHDGHKH